MSLSLRFDTLKQNFLPRPCLDEDAWEVNSDLVAKVFDGDKLLARLVVPAGAYRARRLPAANRARAEAVRARLYALRRSLKDRDDLFLQALRQDGYRRTGLERLKLRARGYLLKQWRYARVEK